MSTLADQLYRYLYYRRGRRDYRKGIQDPPRSIYELDYWRGWKAAQTRRREI